MELTRSELGVLHLSVVGAAALVQARVHGRAAVAQRAGAAAHVGVRGVEVLRTLESLMVVSVGVQPAVAVFPLCVRYPQVPGQISEQQVVQQPQHRGGFPASRRLQVPRASVRLICSSSRLKCTQRNYVTVILASHFSVGRPPSPARRVRETACSSSLCSLISALTSDSNSEDWPLCAAAAAAAAAVCASVRAPPRTDCFCDSNTARRRPPINGRARSRRSDALWVLQLLLNLEQMSRNEKNAKMTLDKILRKSPLKLGLSGKIFKRNYFCQCV